MAEIPAPVAKSKALIGLRRRQHPVLPWDRGKPYFVGRGPLVALLVLALVGTFATGFLSYRHILLTTHSSNIGDSPLCKAEGIVNCDSILLSDYSVILGYFPSSVLGLMGFGFVLWIVLNGLFNQRLRKLVWVLLVLYFFAAIGFSWYYIYIMMFEVDYICTWCIVTHVVNFISLFLILAVAVMKRKEFLLEEPALPTERFYFVTGGLLLPLAIFFAAGYVENILSFHEAKTKYEELANDPVVIMALLKNSPTYEIPVTKDDPVFGNPGAPYPLVLFSDFQCPMCAQTEAYLKKLVSWNPENLCLVYKNYPLTPECNSFIIGSLHPYACPAAKAAYTAYIMKGSTGFWEYGDLLFANQKSFKTQPWLEFAQRVGLDAKVFQNLLDTSDLPAKKIKQDTDLGAGLRLSSTPQVFFEGKNIPQNFKGEFLVDTLEELVKWKYPDRKNFHLRRGPR